MILRIKTTDFSIFAGCRHDKLDNKDLNEYLDMFCGDNGFDALQIFDRTGQMDFDIVCYIQEYIKIGSKRNTGMYTRIERDDNGKIKTYVLGFYKE